jgi:hypothetical protein
MKSITKLILTAGCLFSGAVSAASTCYDSLNETNVIDNFTLLSNGLAQDQVTGLMWMRCAYGQSWDSANSTCTGTPVQITWQDALQLSTTLSDGGYSDWRLPNVKELATVVEKRCVNPSVNEVLFPATSPENFWTSTTVVGTESSAWSIAFYNGKNNTKDKLLDLHVRFVRYAE